MKKATGWRRSPSLLWCTTPATTPPCSVAMAKRTRGVSAGESPLRLQASCAPSTQRTTDAAPGVPSPMRRNSRWNGSFPKQETDRVDTVRSRAREARGRAQSGRVRWLRGGRRRVAHPLGNLHPESCRHTVGKAPPDAAGRLLVGALQEIAQIVGTARRQAPLVVGPVPHPDRHLRPRAGVLRPGQLLRGRILPVLDHPGLTVAAPHGERRPGREQAARAGLARHGGEEELSLTRGAATSTA